VFDVVLRIAIPIYILIITICIVVPYTVLKSVASLSGNFTFWIVMTCIAILVSLYVLKRVIT